MTNTITLDHAASQLILLGDCNVHNGNWLGFSKTEPQREVVEVLAVSNDLTNKIHDPLVVCQEVTHVIQVFIERPRITFKKVLTRTENPEDSHVNSPLGLRTFCQTSLLQ